MEESSTKDRDLSTPLAIEQDKAEELEVYETACSASADETESSGDEEVMLLANRDEVRLHFEIIDGNRILVATTCRGCVHNEPRDSKEHSGNNTCRIFRRADVERHGRERRKK